MKKTLLFCLIAILTINLSAQNEVILRFDHKVGEDQLAFNVQYTETEQGYDFTITRLTYYISEIEITHDGGQTTMIDDTWLLVHAPDDKDFSLGEHNITAVEGIKYWIGIDTAHNHLDPAQYALDHPLALQDPSMHWGWASGYRFIALDGMSGDNMDTEYQLHGIGDANYFDVELELLSVIEDGKVIIPIVADYMRLYRNIDVTTGPLEHSELGLPVILLENMSEIVFSPFAYSDINDNSFDGTFNLGPNPVIDGSLSVKLNLVSGNDYNMIVTDILGREIINTDFDSGNQTVNLEFDHEGIYIVALLQNGVPVITEKVIVNQ